ncbi:MAG: TetR/AcrR family transcriptional regulator [Lachnospiraceae bacterium]|nr:TetR/AcrR family transcriptional regulator [Ruminococcus sp.]MCM1276350.1 TetR/AcrR family transcriptional regulator [Lachnospiraceae bacterium]
MGKRQEAAKLTKRNIILAAKKLHEQRGLADVSVDEIVAEANVSKGSFYVYFKRKEDVASAIAFFRFDELKDSLERCRGTAAKKLARFLTESVRYIEEEGLALCKEWMKSAVSPTDKDGSGIQKLNYDREFILKTLLSAKEKGEIDAPAETLTDVLMAEYYGSVALWCITDGEFPMLEHIKNFSGTLGELLKKYQ